MKIKIINQTENKLFNRKEIQAEIESDATPSKTEVLNLVSKETSVSEDNIKIKGIYGKFGSKVFEVNANVYDSKEDKEKTEHKTKKEIEAEKKELEAKKAEEFKVNEEKPVEEIKEEPAQEQPKEENKTEEKQEEKE